MECCAQQKFPLLSLAFWRRRQTTQNAENSARNLPRKHVRIRTGVCVKFSLADCAQPILLRFSSFSATVGAKRKIPKFLRELSKIRKFRPVFTLKYACKNHFQICGNGKERKIWLCKICQRLLHTYGTSRTIKIQLHFSIERSILKTVFTF